VSRSSPSQTITEETGIRTGSADSGIPGLVLVHSGGQPALRAAPILGAGLEIGRTSFAGIPLDDERMSGRHAHIHFEGGQFKISDLGSRNGTFVDGSRISHPTSFESVRVLRVGRSLFLPVRDVRPFLSASIVRKGDAIAGPTTRAAWLEVERAARFGDVLLLSGESGSGKDVAARVFHAHGPTAGGPFVAVNCAAIPQGLAESLLFGARKGAFSGATADADGYLHAASGGTLFLDEVGDLDIQVQAKLLRALEAKEIVPLGASRPQRIELRLCSATRDLRSEVAKGRFREDLYFRIARPEVRIPPLRERRDEIPWLVASAFGRDPPVITASHSLVEACMLRPWPGNVRELLSELRRIAATARATGQTTVDADDIAANAGQAFEVEPDAPHSSSAKRSLPDPETIGRVLREHGGNVTGAARALGLHRTQLRRWLAKNAPSHAGSDGPDLEDDPTDE
jgi:transcriptional regulator of acetoin/glycerol metabolism